jgi:hypothetical protein
MATPDQVLEVVRTLRANGMWFMFHGGWKLDDDEEILRAFFEPEALLAEIEHAAYLRDAEEERRIHEEAAARRAAKRAAKRQQAAAKPDGK